jgi:hypothetical protein
VGILIRSPFPFRHNAIVRLPKCKRTIAVLPLNTRHTLLLLFTFISNSASSVVTKKNCIVGLLFFLTLNLSAQSSTETSQSRSDQEKQQSAEKKNKYVSPHVTAKKIEERFGTADSIAVDTIPTDFPDNNLLDRYSIANAYNGNMGSPVQSKLFFDRTRKTDFLFSTPYDPYVYTASDLPFFNTKTPYTNVTFLSSYPSEQAEERTKLLLSINSNKRTNFTGLFDYLYNRGRYLNQSNKGLVAGLYGSYAGKHYSAYGAFLYQNFKNYENGGLTNSDYVTDRSTYSEYSSIQMPVNLSNAQSGYRTASFFYNHKYSLGFTKIRVIKKDSTVEEFVPVTSFIHTLKIQSDIKRYREATVDTLFYSNTYRNKTAHSDTTAFLSIRNTFAIQMDEKFNRLLKFGLTAFIENEVNRYMHLDSNDLLVHTSEQNTRIGGILAKNEGRTFRYNLQGNFVIVGPRIGDFELSGKVGGYFTLWNDSVTLKAMASITNRSASYFWEHYYSNHFKWENNFDKEFRTYIGGSVELPKRHVKVGLQVSNNTNYLYFDSNAMPAQASGSVQIVALDASVDFHMGHHWGLENKGVYQVSSNQNIIPLPALALYNNLYFQSRIAKVLRVQLGVSSHYNTAYYAPSYMPATGQFYVQNTKKVGDYPLLNIYANFHLKQTRFFLEYYNAGLMFISNYNYFSMPNYPLNPTTLKVGISVNWYN